MIYYVFWLPEKWEQPDFYYINRDQYWDIVLSPKVKQSFDEALRPLFIYDKNVSDEKISKELQKWVNPTEIRITR